MPCKGGLDAHDGQGSQGSSPSSLILQTSSYLQPLDSVVDALNLPATPVASISIRV